MTRSRSCCSLACTTCSASWVSAHLAAASSPPSTCCCSCRTCAFHKTPLRFCTIKDQYCTHFTLCGVCLPSEMCRWEPQQPSPALHPCFTHRGRKVTLRPQHESRGIQPRMTVRHICSPPTSKAQDRLCKPSKGTKICKCRSTWDCRLCSCRPCSCFCASA